MRAQSWMRLLIATASFLLVSIHIQSVEARTVPRNADSSLNPNARNYLRDLYDRFLEALPNLYQRQFAVLTVNSPENLLPCPLEMTQQPLSSTANYLANTPTQGRALPEGRFTPTRHSEEAILHNFDQLVSLMTGNLSEVHLVSYYNPCEDCSLQLRNLVRRYPRVTFYIGYVTEYHGTIPGTNPLTHFIQLLGREPNVRYGQITPTSDICRGSGHDIRRRSNTCPVHCGSSGRGCFPSHAVVYTSNTTSQVKMMKDLQIGDEILSMTPFGEVVYSPIIAFLDRLPSAKAEFMVLKTENNLQLQLTPTHLVHTNASSKLIFASEVHPGNYVFTLDPQDHTMKLSKVTKVDTVSAVGMYAPLTEEGNIVVDNIVTSCYADYEAEQSFIHTIFAPLRFLYRTKILELTDNSQVQRGIHWYARLLMNINSYI